MYIREIQDAKLLHSSWGTDLHIWRTLAFCASVVLCSSASSSVVKYFANQICWIWFCISHCKLNWTPKSSPFPLSPFSVRGITLCEGSIIMSCVYIYKAIFLHQPVLLLNSLGTWGQSWGNSKPCSQDIFHGSKYIQRTLASSLLSSCCNNWDCVREPLNSESLE